MLVSEMEKKAETTSRTINAISSVWRGISSKCSHQLVEKSKSVSAAGQTVSRQHPVRAPLSDATALRARICFQYRRAQAKESRQASNAWPRGRANRRARAPQAALRR